MTINSARISTQHIANPERDGELNIWHLRDILANGLTLFNSIGGDAAIIKNNLIKVVHVKRDFTIYAFFNNRIMMDNFKVGAAMIGRISRRGSGFRSAAFASRCCSAGAWR